MKKKGKTKFKETKKLFSRLKIISNISLVSAFISILGSNCLADRIAYNRILNISAESDEIIVYHHHDWSNHTEKSRSKMMARSLDPFTAENNYAYIECVDKKTGKRLFKNPTPALTYLYISSDSNYIIGLSNIKLDNPYHFVIFDRNGNLVKKRHIYPEEAALTLSEYDEFKKKFSADNVYLISKDRIIIDSDRVYIDFLDMGWPYNSSEGAREYLQKKESGSHLSKNFSQSVMNWISWYCEENPGVQLKYENKKLLAVSLLDRKGKRFEIPVYEATPKI